MNYESKFAALVKAAFTPPLNHAVIDVLHDAEQEADQAGELYPALVTKTPTASWYAIAYRAIQFVGSYDEEARESFIELGYNEV